MASGSSKTPRERHLSGAAGRLDEAVENCGISDSQVGKNLSVQIDLGTLEPVDELTVAHSTSPAGGVDPDDPESTPIAFFLPAMTGCVSFGPCASLLGSTQELPTASTKAFHSTEELVLLAQSGYPRSGSWHISVLLHSGSQPEN
tara:strand:+ start:1685 stop:2119 length:435 start_codon:yes stop_codon:yes gene_type:complete